MTRHRKKRLLPSGYFMDEARPPASKKRSGSNQATLEQPTHPPSPLPSTSSSSSFLQTSPCPPTSLEPRPPPPPLSHPLPSTVTPPSCKDQSQVKYGLGYGDTSPQRNTRQSLSGATDANVMVMTRTAAGVLQSAPSLKGRNNQARPTPTPASAPRPMTPTEQLVKTTKQVVEAAPVLCHKKGTQTEQPAPSTTPLNPHQTLNLKPPHFFLNLFPTRILNPQASRSPLQPADQEPNMAITH
ncbi:proteoglycan 4-like [Macrobrachium rosenbergii]|uniref:proteoglycan 4-like n=1 Tax=Macrobrachium rosenbergii TaxID=79674 RepID=UPI0034D62D80